MNLKQLFGIQKEETTTKGLFGKVIGRDAEKKLLAMALDAESPIAINFYGPPGTAKSMLLKAIKERFPSITEYIIGSDTTKAGLFDLIYAKQNKIKYLIIDEIEYLSKQDQSILLNLIEGGLIREVKRSMKREVKDLRIWVFATCNNPKKLSEALKSRFLMKYVAPYDYQSFEQIAIGRLMQEHSKMKVEFARAIATAVWEKKGEDSNIRDCVRISHMAKTMDEIAFMVEEI
jgi:Holliday junction DNA helicase RuvB